VRSMIRQASLSKDLNTKLLAAAADALKRLMENNAYANLSTDLVALKNYISARLTPEQHLQELAKEKITAASSAELTKTIDILIKEQDDGTSCSRKYSELPASVKKPDLVDWIMTFQCQDDSAKKHAIDKWKQTHSLPWLVAAACIVEGKDPNAAAILADIEKNKTGPAQWTLFFEGNRLNLELGKKDKVRADLDKVLSHPPADLPAGSLNALKLQRLLLSVNLDEVVRYGVQTPLSNCSNGGTSGVPDDVDVVLKTGKSSDKMEPLLTVTAAEAIASKMPLSVLTQLAGNKLLPQALKNNIAWTSWVRAVLVGDDASAKELAQILKPLNKKKEKLVDAYLSAATPEDRKFAAAFLMLKFSSAQPFVSSGPLMDDDYGDSSGWWWSANPSPSYPSEGEDGQDGSVKIPKFDPAFVTAAQKAQAKQQLASLAKVEAAPNYLGKIVLAYAKSHPDDLRIPEALHYAVNATHYGSTDDASKVLSKQEFQLLHTKYKANPWTKKTPYFY
ncbi:MAG: hypothetical protein K2X81_24280, partial [Candidatus Obscuribacterales bacterium]|nr:hypothetical protein [Candidatus Obscuribacterales bacterium]